MNLTPRIPITVIVVALLQCCFVPMGALLAQTNTIAIFPDEDPLTPENLKLVWPSTPGLRYEVKQSTNLQSWSTAPGYPATANGPAQQMPFLTEGNARFFQVRELDEQPPAIVSQYPQDGGFAVPRFADLTIQLSDVTGIDTNSICLTVGSLGTFTLTNAQLTLSNGVLTFINGGSIALGAWGTNVQATLVAADTLGNAGTNTWNFTLEVQPQVVTNLFVFGSPQAQRTGQRIGNIPAASLAARSGPIPMDDAEPWTLELVETNRLELSYTNTAPDFAVNTYVCNLTPATTNEIFYRKIISVSDNAGIKCLTLFTTNVPLAEMLQEGSMSLSPNSVIYQLTNNVILPALAFDGAIPIGSVGVDTTETLYDEDGVTLTLEEAKFLYTPSLSLSFETHNSELKRFAAGLTGRLETALVPQLTIAGTLADTKQFDLYSHKILVFVGWAGVLPVWLEFDFSVTAEVGYNLAADATLTTGVRQNADLSFGVDYVKNRSPQLQGTPGLSLDPLEIVPFTFVINGSASAYAKIVPQLDVRVDSLAGLYANVDPRVEVNGNANFLNGQLTNADLTLDAKADLNVGLGVIGVGNVDPPLATFNLLSYTWTTNYPPPNQLIIQTQPQSQEVVVGSSAAFYVSATSGQPISYQWFNNGTPMIGQDGSSLILNNVTLGYAGQYYVQLTSSGQTTNSSTATLSVRIPSTPAGMVLIPAGSFTMGDTFSEYDRGFVCDVLPLHTVYTSAFYMDKYDVTKALWDSVYHWATNHGYSFNAAAGAGKAANHPVQTLNWYDAVKWCNARSEMEGRTPAYYTNAALLSVYRTGMVDLDNSSVNWNAGYRLPTEAEWEKAARGGVSGQRFPCGNTISESQANYYSGMGSYDLSNTGCNPTFNDGSWAQGPPYIPYTSPVGYFAPNGYGLYDMAGNMQQWCWDWYDSSWYSNDGATQTNTCGPVSSPIGYRVMRGGCWESEAYFLRCACRGGDRPIQCYSGFYGLRCVRGF